MLWCLPGHPGDKRESLTLMVQLLQEQRPLGVSSFLWAGEEVTVSLIPTALLTSIAGRLRLTASVVVSIYKRLAPLNTHSSLERHANVFIAEDYPSCAQGLRVFCSKHKWAGKSGGKSS